MNWRTKLDLKSTSSSKPILIGIAIPVITLLIVGVQTYDSEYSSQQETKLVNHTQQIINSLKDILISMIDAETGQRGFVITGNLKYLEPYNLSLSNIKSRLVDLHTLTSDNPFLQSNLNASLVPLVERKLAELSKTIEVRKQLGFDAASKLVESDQGKNIMDQIRKTIASMIMEADILLKSRSADSILKDQNLIFITIIEILISSIITGITLLVTYSRLQFKFSQINKLLESEVNKRTMELAQSYILLERTNVELKKHDELQKQFINIAAHELRTPVQAMLGYSEMLNNSQQRNRQYEKNLLRNADRLDRLSSDILDASKIESDTLKLNKSKFDLNENINDAVNDIMNSVGSLTKSSNIKIVFEPKESITVIAYKQRILQVIYNLVNNALKFTDSGTITISTESKNVENKTVVTVTDTGEGIDPEILPRLFLKFTSKSGTGTGLGLFISKSVIEAHGGTIEGYNNPSGKGATFTFTLPLGS